VFHTAGIKKKILLPLMIFLNVYPLFLIVVWTYSSITGTPVLVPSNGFFDYLVIYPFWLYILIAVQSILFFIPVDALRFFLYPFYKKRKQKVYKYISIIILLLVVSFILYVPGSVIYDYYNIQVRTVNYYKPNLPEQLNNLKIALIGDIHMDRYTDSKRLSKYISLVNKQSPDLILIAGDIISSTPNYISKAADYLGTLKSKYGICSCVGDHDNWAYRHDYTRSLKEITEALSKNNITMLNDKNLKLNIKGNEVFISFVTDTYVERVSRQELNGLLSGSTNYALKIVLTHQPGQKIVTRAIKTDYDFLFAGHTHGGQITFLFPFFNLTPTQLETKYVRGNFRFNKMLMIVNRGLGMSLVPMRYNSEPEITIINIRKGNT